MLRSNVTDWSPEELWRTYMQLTEAAAAFRIQKTDLQLRPIWHQKQERVEAHPGVLSVLMKDAGATRANAVGWAMRRVFEELADSSLVTIRKRCVARPTEHQAVLLQHLGLSLPSSLEMTEEQ